MTRSSVGLLVLAGVLALSGCEFYAAAPGSVSDFHSASTTDYSAKHFGGWTDADQDGCHTREEVLERDAPRPADRDGDGCADDGAVTDRYTGELVQTSSADIDHIVSRRDAWDSGASQFTRAQRVLFSNDLANLWATSASRNRRKGDDEPQHAAKADPGKEWLPRDPGTRCKYATAYRSVKTQWRLVISVQQAAALDQMC